MHAEVVTPDYFSVVGARPRLGRTLQPSDDALSAPPVIVVSEAFWRRRFGGDPEVVGRSVTVNGHPAEIAGVVAAPFEGVDMPNLLPTAVWVPAGFAGVADPQHRPDRDIDRDARSWFAKGRLRSGVTIGQAAAEVATIANALDAEFPIGTSLPARLRTPEKVERGWSVVPANAVYVHESVHRLVAPTAVAASAMALLVLLVACTNLANLLLARGASRRNEFSVRYALGGSRWRIVREQLLESVIVVVMASIGAAWIAKGAVAYLADSAIRMGPGVWMRLTPETNASLVLATAAMTLLAFIVFGIVPAMQLTRRDLARTLAANNNIGAAPRWRGQRTLVAAQVTVSVALVSAALFSVQQVVRAKQHDTGLDLDRYAAALVDFELAGYEEDRAARCCGERSISPATS